MEARLEWRTIGFNNDYEVSSNGDVRSRMRMVKGKSGLRIHAERILKAYCRGKTLGYLCVKLPSNGAYQQFGVSHLVCIAFHGPRPENHDVDHIDGDTKNNAASNLRWLHQSINRAQGPRRRVI
jgi:hypothetical protein